MCWSVMKTAGKLLTKKLSLKQWALLLAGLIFLLWYAFCLPRPLFDAPLSVVLEDRNGQIWVGTLKGLCRYDEGRFIPIALPPSDAPEPLETLDANRVMCIAEDAAGQLWLGTDGSGLYHYDGNTFTNYTTADGLAGNSISSIVPDEKGGLWLGTMFNGVSYYAEGKTQLHFKANRTRATIESNRS